MKNTGLVCCIFMIPAVCIADGYSNSVTVEPKLPVLRTQQPEPSRKVNKIRDDNLDVDCVAALKDLTDEIDSSKISLQIEQDVMPREN